MLAELAIRNVAIIDELRVGFAPGLNIITGETGAGKSILIGAVNLLLGERASMDLIRTGEEAATVEAFFELQGRDDVLSLLEEWGVRDGDSLVVRRVLSRSGKNRLFINGHGATLAMLSKLGEVLMNICGQHEHQVLLREENHVTILDGFGGYLTLREDYEACYARVQELREGLHRLEELNRNREERHDFLIYQLREIDEVAPEASEDERLREERLVLINAQRLSDLATTAHEALYGADGAALERVKTALDAVRDIIRIDSHQAFQEEPLTAAYYQLEEAAFALRSYAQGLVFDPRRLEAVDERLERLGHLKRKHGGTLEAVLAKRQAMEGELRRMLSCDEERKAVEEKLDAAMDDLMKKGRALTAARRAAAERIASAVEDEIRDLRMAGARFEVFFREQPGGEDFRHFGPHGQDDVAFYLSTNPGEDPKPLSRVASGGELSRIVLAMKKVLAGQGGGTIIFDEVDSGIGGATASVVGEKIHEVARHHQVLCITHLPQIACFADRHYRVMKRVIGEKTVTSVEILSHEERLDELTRMLGGMDVTEAARIHAREMLRNAGTDQRFRIREEKETPC